MILNKIKKFFTGKEKDSHAGENDILTAMAVILTEVACSDSDFTEDERRMVSHLIKEDFSLDPEKTEDIISEAESILASDTNRWKYINTVNSNFSVQQKLEFLEKVWRVIYADKRMDKFEDHFVHQLAKVLHIPHYKLIETKLKVKEKNG